MTIANWTVKYMLEITGKGTDNRYYLMISLSIAPFKIHDHYLSTRPHVSGPF